MDNNASLSKYLAASGTLSNPLIVHAFQHIDRAKFIKPEYVSRAYEDRTLPIGSGQTISKPSEVAFMIEQLKPNRGDKILDVGTGSGWTTALLADITGYAGFVYGVEIMPELLDMSRSNVGKFMLRNVIIEPAHGELGLAKFAPYDKILVSAFVDRIPSDLVEQLKNGGTMVIPVKNRVVKVEKDENGRITEEEFYEHTLEPLIDTNQ